MKKVLKNLFIAILLVAMLFSLTACGNETVETIQREDVEIVDTNDDVVNEEPVENADMDGIYVGSAEDDIMEGLVVISLGENDSFVVMKDKLGSGYDRLGKANHFGNYLEGKIRNEVYTITDEGENVKFTHPIMTLSEIVTMTPATDDLCGIYQNGEDDYIALYKNFNDELTIVYIDAEYDISLNVTLAEYTTNGNTIEGKDDSYSEPVKVTIDGDKLTFNIESENRMWDRANIEYTKMK